MNLVQIFGQIAQDHAQVNAFGFGDVWNITAETVRNYPLLWVELRGNKIGNNTITYKLRVYWMDLVKPDISNENEIKSNSIMILNGIFYLLRDLYDLEPEFDVNVVPFEEKFSDRVAGSYADVDILVPNTFGWCDEPMKDCSASGSTFVPFPVQPGGGCGGGLSVLNSPTVSFDGSGTTCLPLIANVNISAFPGNTLIANIDGLYVSGSTSVPPFLASTQIAFGSSGNTITSTPGLTWNPANGLQTVHLLVSNTAGTEDLIIAEEGFVGLAAGNTTFDLSNGGIDILTEGNTIWTSQGGFDFAGAITATSLESTGTTMVVANSSGLLSTLPLPTFSNVFGADDGLSISGTNAILGGVTLTNKTIDLSVNNNYLWLKESLAPSTYSQFIVGGASGGTAPGSTWGFPHPALLISKSITADGNNSVFLEMSNPDAPSGSSYNGFLILNYQNVAGQVQPNIRAASNALAGQGGAFNLDLAGRDSYSVNGYQDNYSHFSIWYYDYDQYFYTNPGAPGPMLNSDFVNFNNGQGGGAGSTRFFMIDKHYNTLLGKGTWNQTPASTLDIQDNGSGQTGIYQRGATSPNWFAGDTVIGGPLPAHFGSTYQLTVSGNTQITGVLELTGMTTPDQDGAGPGMISCQGIPLLHFGANDSQDTYSVYLGMYAGYAARNTSGADVQSAVAVGFGALQAYTGVQNFWGAVLGTGCGQQLTSGIGDLIAGWATANTSTTLNGSTLLGSMAGIVVNGTDLTFVGVGAGGSPNYSSIYTATATASGSTVIGAWAGSGLSHVTMDNIILLGRFANKTTNNSVVWNNTTIIGNSITTDLNNVAIFGSSTQDVIIGNSNPTVDNGYKLQVNGSTYINGNALITSLASTGTTMVVASSTGLLGTQPIPQNAVSSVSNSDGTLTISPITGAVIASLNLAHANTWTGGQTFSARTIFGASTTGHSSTNFIAGVAPTTPIPGDQWFDGSNNFFFYSSGSTTTLGIAAGAENFAVQAQAAVGMNYGNTNSGGGFNHTFYVGGSLSGTAAARLNASSGYLNMATQIGGNTAPTSTWLSIIGGTTTRSQINLTAGVAPTAPNIGDIWFDGSYINVDTSGITILRNNLASTVSSTLGGLILNDTTPATSAQTQYSPGVIFSGQAWSTQSGTGSETVQAMIGLQPVSGSSPSTITGNLVLSFNINGAWVSPFAFSSAATNWSFGAAGLTINPVGGAGISLCSLPATANQFHYNSGFTFEQVLAVTAAGFGTSFINGSGASTNTTGNVNQYQFVQSFAPTSGSGTFSLISLQPTINQTGGASGITTALSISPTLTSAANFYAIEVLGGKIVSAASTTNIASLNIPTGSAPTSPVEGDIWKTGSHLFIYLNGTTVQIV